MIRKNVGLLVFAIPTMAVVFGCGDNSGLGTRYPVSGMVTYNGKPLERGNISFAPDGPGGRAAGGTIVEGHYTLTTQDPDDGALPGKYKVSVVAKETDASKVELKVKKRGEGALSEAEKKSVAAMYPQKIAAKATAAAKSLIPAKYNSPTTSGLTYEVKEEASSAVNFELKD